MNKKMPNETQNEFVRLRKEGKSYAEITQILHISKATCSQWNKKFIKSDSDAGNHDSIESQPRRNEQALQTRIIGDPSLNPEEINAMIEKTKKNLGRCILNPEGEFKEPAPFQGWPSIFFPYDKIESKATNLLSPGMFDKLIKGGRAFPVKDVISKKAAQEQPRDYPRLVVNSNLFPQNNFINCFNSTDTSKKKFIKNKSDNTSQFSNSSLVITIDQLDQNSHGLRLSAKTLNIVNTRYWMQNISKNREYPQNLRGKFPLLEYMALRGIQDTPKNRENFLMTLRADIMTLLSMKVIYKKNINHMRGTFHPILFYQNLFYRGGDIHFQFSEEFAALLKNAFVIPLGDVFFKLSHKNPSAWYMAYKLALHNGISNNRKIGTCNTISVLSLLNSIPTIPKADMLKGRHFYDRIISPFESSLDSLVEADMLKEWKYLADSNAYPNESDLIDKRYADFIGWKVHFELKK